MKARDRTMSKNSNLVYTYSISDNEPTLAIYNRRTGISVQKPVLYKDWLTGNLRSILLPTSATKRKHTARFFGGEVIVAYHKGNAIMLEKLAPVDEVLHVFIWDPLTEWEDVGVFQHRGQQVKVGLI